MQFFLKLTALGRAKLAAANTGGPAVSLTQIAVGDGGGNPIPVTPPPTKLVREVYQGQINALFVNQNDPTIMMAEAIIPSGVGGFAIREIAIKDSAGDVFAVGNFPETYKPLAAEGSTREMIIHAAIKVSDASNVQLVIDASIVVATRAWVLGTITAAFLLPGGTTGQVLTKRSNASGDVYWRNVTDAVNIVVNSIREIQATVAGQTVYTLKATTTDGIAVYVEGVRLFDFTVLNQTQIQLAASRPAGNEIVFVQNEPNEPLKLRRLVAGRSFFMGQFS